MDVTVLSPVARLPVESGNDFHRLRHRSGQPAWPTGSRFQLVDLVLSRESYRIPMLVRLKADFLRMTSNTLQHNEDEKKHNRVDVAEIFHSDEFELAHRLNANPGRITQVVTCGAPGKSRGLARALGPDAARRAEAGSAPTPLHSSDGQPGPRDRAPLASGVTARRPTGSAQRRLPARKVRQQHGPARCSGPISPGVWIEAEAERLSFVSRKFRPGANLVRVKVRRSVSSLWVPLLLAALVYLRAYLFGMRTSITKPQRLYPTIRSRSQRFLSARNTPIKQGRVAKNLLWNSHRIMSRMMVAARTVRASMGPASTSEHRPTIAKQARTDRNMGDRKMPRLPVCPDLSVSPFFCPSRVLADSRGRVLGPRRLRWFYVSFPLSPFSNFPSPSHPVGGQGWFSDLASRGHAGTRCGRKGAHGIRVCLQFTPRPHVPPSPLLFSCSSVLLPRPGIVENGPAVTHAAFILVSRAFSRMPDEDQTVRTTTKRPKVESQMTKKCQAECK